MARDYDGEQIPTVHDLAAVDPHREGPGFEQVVFRGIDQMIGLTRIGPEKPDDEPHSHPFEQSNLLVDGRLDFVVDDEVLELEPYDALTIPPEVPHTSRAVPGETATLLAFWPLREDRLDATAYQDEFPDL